MVCLYCLLVVLWSPVFPHTCHSEEHRDEESRKQNTECSHTGSFAYAQDDKL